MFYLFIQYPKCSTCIKAKKWLIAHRIPFTERHIVDNNPSVDELTQWIMDSNLPIKSFFNTSGTIYKEMNLSKVLPTLSETEQIELLASNGMLVKRPLVIGGSTVLVGFREPSLWETTLKSE